MARNRRIPKKTTREQREGCLFFFFSDRWTERRKNRRKPKGMLCRGEAVSGCGPGIGGERSRGCYDEMELPRSSKHTE